MNSEYRQRELEQATQQWAEARVRLASARTSKARREAAEEVEFWGNKMAFLEKAA